MITTEPTSPDAGRGAVDGAPTALDRSRLAETPEAAELADGAQAPAAEDTDSPAEPIEPQAGSQAEPDDQRADDAAPPATLELPTIEYGPVDDEPEEEDSDPDGAEQGGLREDGAVDRAEGGTSPAESAEAQDSRADDAGGTADTDESEAADEAAAEAQANVFAAVPELLRPALERRGFDALTSVQTAVLAADAAGRDLQVCSQTGSGKTVALGFAIAPQLAAARSAQGPEALIIVPTRELATQVSTELRWLLADVDDTFVTVVTGGHPLFRDREALSRRPRVLVGTPGRLLDHVKSGLLDLSGVRELVLDEADQMLDLGFREELEGILETTPQERRTHLVSATFPQGIVDLTKRYQREPLEVHGEAADQANANIEHAGHLVHQRNRYGALVNLLLLAGDERSLVFVERRADALEVAEMLDGDGIDALPLSGELTQGQRERTLAAFRAGRTKVLVATDVAARGLDVPDVTTVIHTAAPIDSETYTHRSGRTGRAGKRGRSVILTPPSRRRKVTRLLDEAGLELTWTPVPSADEVRQVLAERQRSALRERLQAALGEQAEGDRIGFAKELLESHEAEPLVAAMLGLLEPKTSAAARDVEALHVRDDRRDRFRDDDRDRNRRPQRQERRERPGGGVRFFINWGSNQGANPARLLAAICRRGRVTGADVGSIAVHPNASTFDVNPAVAEQFERDAGRRDARDPKVFIRPDRGPQPNRGTDRGPDRGPRGNYRDRGPDRGPSRSYDRGPDRGPSRGYDRGPDRGPSRGYDRGPDRGPSRGYDRGPDRGPSRGYDRGPDRGPSRGYDRGPDRGPARGHDRGPDRGGDRRFDRGPNRGPDRGPDRGGDRSHDRGPDRGYNRGGDRSYERRQGGPRQGQGARPRY